MATVVNRQTMSDAELIAASRLGDAEAFGELYLRHVPAARAAARAMCHNRSDVDDLVAEAFLNVLRILQNGNGPEVAFRPYLLVAVRNRFYDRTRRSREDPVDEPTDELNLRLAESGVLAEDKMLAAEAFAALPERWQFVLWHTEVEGRTPAEIAPLIGLAPNAVAALAYRAREGLRQAYLQAHLQTPRELACQECAGQLAAYVRDALSDRDRRRVDTHLYGCESCRALLAELIDTNSMLRAALLPVIAGVPATAYLSGLSGKGVVSRFGRMSRLQQAGIAVGSAVAAGVTIAVIAAIVSTGGSKATSAPPYSLPPRNMVGTIVPSTTIPFQAGAIPPSTSIALQSSPPVPTEATSSTEAPATPPTLAPNRTPARSRTPARVPAPAGSVVAPTTPSSGTSPAAGTTPTTGTTTPTTVTTTPTTGTTTPTTGTTTPTTATTVVTTTTVASNPTTTTPPVVVPQVGLASLQLGVGVLGGEVRVQVTVSATALPTNQFRTNAFSNLVVSAALPAGVSVTGVDNPAWSCTAQGVCTIASLATGSSSTAVLRLGLATSVAVPFTFSPDVSNPPNAVVQSQPLSIDAAAVAGLQIHEFARGSVAAVGNTVVGCIDILIFCVPGINIDALNLGTNSSTADLTFSGTVAKAVLVWSGDSASVDRDKVKLVMPDGTSIDVVADKVRLDDYSTEYKDEYVAYKDVTAQIAKSGTYAVANLQTSFTSFGGWSLIVLTHDATQPERSLMIAVPLSYVTSTAPSSIAVGGSSASAAHVVVSAFEGDESGTVNDTVMLNKVDVGGTDPFRGAIFGSPRNPQLLTNYRVDLLDVTATNVPAGSALDFATSDDSVMIAAVGISLDLS